MKQRISLWAAAGLSIACCWVIYVTMVWPFTNQNVNWTLAAITAPASLIGRAMPLKYYWFILLNGAAYALVGLITELMRRAVVRLLKLAHRPGLA